MLEGDVEKKTMASYALLFAIGTFILWGTTNFLVAYGEKNQEIDPKLFTAIMWMSMGALGVALFTYIWVSGQYESIDTKIVFPVAAGICLGVGLLSFVYAMSHSEMSTGGTAAIATSNAVFTTMLALVFLREQLSLKEWIGIGTVIVGIIILRI